GGDESVDREFGSCVCSVADADSAAKDDQGGHSADHDRVCKHFEDTEESLFYRVICISGCVGDRACTETGLIGEDSPGDTLLHTEKEAANDSACHGCRRERAFDDRGKYSGYTVDVQEDHAQSKD